MPGRKAFGSYFLHCMISKLLGSLFIKETESQRAGVQDGGSISPFSAERPLSTQAKDSGLGLNGGLFFPLRFFSSLMELLPPFYLAVMLPPQLDCFKVEAMVFSTSGQFISTTVVRFPCPKGVTH